MGSTKKATKKNPIMNYEQLLSSVFTCFHGQKFEIKKKKLHCSVRTKKLLNIKKEFEFEFFYFFYFFKYFLIGCPQI